MPARIEHRLGNYPVEKHGGTELVDTGGVLPSRVYYDRIGRRPQIGERVSAAITPFYIVDAKTGHIESATLNDLGAGEAELTGVNALDTIHCQKGAKACIALATQDPNHPLWVVTNETSTKILKLADEGEFAVPPFLISTTGPRKGAHESNLGPELGILLVVPNKPAEEEEEYLARSYMRLSELMQDVSREESLIRVYREVSIMKHQDGPQPKRLAPIIAASLSA